MKKIFKKSLFLFMIFNFIFLTTNVKADLTCSYNMNFNGLNGCYATGSFSIKYDSSGKATLDYSSLNSKTNEECAYGIIPATGAKDHAENYYKNHNSCPNVYFSPSDAGGVDFFVYDENVMLPEFTTPATLTGSSGSGSSGGSGGSGGSTSKVNKTMCSYTGIPVRNKDWKIDVDFKIKDGVNYFEVGKSGEGKGSAKVDGIVSIDGYSFYFSKDYWTPIFAYGKCPETLYFQIKDGVESNIVLTGDKPSDIEDGSYGTMNPRPVPERTESNVDPNAMFNDSGNVGDNFCTEPAVKNVLRFFGYLIFVLRFAVPFIIIAKGTFLFYNAVVKDSSDQLSKSAKEFGIKLAIGITIFFIPTLISAALGLYNDFSKVESDYNTCATCLLKPGDC